MGKKVKIGISIGISTIAVFVGVAFKSTKEDKIGEGAVIKEVQNKEGELIEVIRYSDDYESQLDYMYEQVTK